MSADLASQLIEEAPIEIAGDLIARLEKQKAADIFDELDSDVQADMIAELDPEDAEAILSGIDPADAASGRRLAEYPSDTAGGLMLADAFTFGAIRLSGRCCAVRPAMTRILSAITASIPTSWIAIAALSEWYHCAVY